jgi:hypothetical protein
MVILAVLLLTEHVYAGDSHDKKPGNDNKREVVRDCRYDHHGAGTGTSTGFFPSDDIFRPLIADPKQPQFFAIWQSTKILAENSSANIGSVAIGENFGFYTKRYGCDGVQISLLTGIFSQFNLDTSNAELINTDFNVGIPVTWRMEDWSARVRFYHQSSHVGDEFLVAHPEVTPSPFNYEEVDAILSYDYKWARGYAGGGVLVNSDPDTLDRNRVQWGFDIRVPSIASKLGRVFERMAVIPVVAADFKAFEELDWFIHTNLLVGMELSRPDSLRRFRIMFNYYYGFNPYGPYGQSVSQKIESFGIGAYFLF